MSDKRLGQMMCGALRAAVMLLAITPCAVSFVGCATTGTGTARAVSASEPLFEAEFIFPPEDFHNHSSSIVESPKGDLIACWFHGKGERNDDTLVISGARKEKGATAWSAPFVMADNQNLPDQNCTLFIDPQGRLFLFWISAMDNLVRSYFLKYRVSTDYEGDGPPVWDWQDAIFCRPQDLEATYLPVLDDLKKRLEAAPESEVTAEQRAEFAKRLEERKVVAADKLWQRLGWMPRQPPIMISEKRMMLGLYSDTFSCSMMAFTEDGGLTWEFSKPMVLPGGGNIQPSLVRKRNGNIVAFMRSAGLIRQIRRAESSDGGMTWTDVPLDIPNPGSSVAVAGLQNGHWVLVCNDTPRGRHIQTVYLSDDEGQTWKWKRSLENLEPEKGTGSYPTVIQTADGSIHCTYTHEDKAHFEGKTIKHVRFNEAWIMAGNQ